MNEFMSFIPSFQPTVAEWMALAAFAFGMLALCLWVNTHPEATYSREDD